MINNNNKNNAQRYLYQIYNGFLPLTCVNNAFTYCSGTYNKCLCVHLGLLSFVIKRLVTPF